ncbi:MAG: hypothetical protein IID44_16020 [Planctomycetes bacterium]|nr:hypothetical protein [Planctomycetota bacterium]
MAASREHQGLIISLIIFVMLTVMLAVMSYVLYSRDEEAIAKVDTADTKRAEWQKKADATQGKLNEMKILLGFSIEDVFESSPPQDSDIKSKWKEDMEIYKGVYPDDEGQLNYSKLIGYLASEIRKQDDQIRTQGLAIIKLGNEFTEMQKNVGVEVATFDGRFRAATTDLEKRTAEFATKLEGYFKSRDTAARAFALSTSQATQKVKDDAAQIARINEDFQRSDRLVSALRRQLNVNVKEATEVADGAIMSINQTTGRVYINLGRADSLRPQVTFSVHGRNVANVAQAKPKAKIRVTRLLNEPHLAEARVVEEDIANPIIRGDRIFSPAWSPGRKIRFAFAGTIDMDGDGRSDLRRIRDLVAINNGIVDASPDENGNMVGQITTNTRYLVVGEAKLTNNAAIEARSAAIDQARENGVEQLSVTEFLDMMGWVNTRNTVSLGRGARSSDFAPKKGTVRKGTDNVKNFKPRRP